MSDRKQSHLLAFFFMVVTALFILSASIAVPILSKGFYKQEVKRLNLVEETEYSEKTILTAYSEMLDYCNGFREEFSVGELGFSKEGASHFADCRKLFILDRVVLEVTAVIGILWAILRRFVRVRPAYWKGHSPLFYGAIFLLATFLLIGGLAALNFDKFFVIFHAVLFPGKTNWLFDPWVDEVINILPETFFMHAGFFIVILILVLASAFILGDLVFAKKRKK